MVGSDDTKKYIKDLKKKIRKETEVYCRDKEKNSIYDYLDWAERNARIGLDVPSFSSLSIPKRIIYRWAGRILIKVLKIITINQRQFNLSILDALRSIIDDCNKLKFRFAEYKTQSDTKIMELKNKLEEKDIEINKLNNIINYLKNNLIQLEKGIKNLSGSVGKDTRKMGKARLQNLTREIDHSLDSLYVFLEDNLRGSRKEIKERLNVYIPIIKKANVGTKDSSVLDIGCGRGEWLELLKEANLHARGLDPNKVMVEICKERGLDVIEAEVFSFMKSVSNDSLGAVTGFHLIEHYGFDFLIKLLDEILRVLKPGGLVILETPNPGNVLVGSYSFYLDPTHNKPLPSLLVKLALESRGFINIEVIDINPYNDDLKLKEDDSETSKRFNDYFYGPQDYAVVGYKI